MKYGNFYKFVILLGAILLVAALGMKCFADKTGKQNQGELVVTSNRDPDQNQIQDQDQNQIQIQDQITTIGESSIADFTYPEEPTIREEEIEPEMFSPYESVTQCYFTNTEATIDVMGVLPINAQGSLVESTQKYLDEQEIPAQELYCLDDSVKTKDTETSFQVKCIDIDNLVITITYNRDRQLWLFTK